MMTPTATMMPLDATGPPSGGPVAGRAGPAAWFRRLGCRMVSRMVWRMVWRMSAARRRLQTHRTRPDQHDEGEHRVHQGLAVLAADVTAEQRLQDPDPDAGDHRPAG